MTASTIPAAIDALVAAVRALAPSTVQVVDGFPRFAIADVDFISIGGTVEATATGVQEPEDEDLGRTERYALQLRALSKRGVQTEQKVVRDLAFAMVELVNTALQADPTLGGVVHLAELGGPVDLFQTDAETAKTSTRAEVAFSVLVHASV